MQTESNTSTPTTENQIRQNDWAVASAAKNLLGRVSPNGLAVALALAAHVPFDGAELKVWPSWRRIQSVCGIGSRHTIGRVLRELEQHGFIDREGGSRRKSTLYTLHFVTVPDHVIERTLRAVEKASRAVEASPLSGAESAPLSGAESAPESYQSNSLNKERKKEGKTGRGRHDPPPRIDGKTINSHPLSSPFEAKEHLPINQVSEFIEPSEEARRAWAVEKMVEIAGPAASTHLGEGRKDKAPDSHMDEEIPEDWQPWVKLGITRRKWLRMTSQEQLDAQAQPIYQDQDIRAS